MRRVRRRNNMRTIRQSSRVSHADGHLPAALPVQDLARMEVEARQNQDSPHANDVLHLLRLVNGLRGEIDVINKKLIAIQRIANSMAFAAGKLPRNIPDCLKELEGRLIEYTIPLPAPSCVYFLIDGCEVVYIGQTLTLLRRLADHVGKKAFTRVLYLPIMPCDLEVIERSLIERLCPKYNCTHNPQYGSLGQISAW